MKRAWLAVGILLIATSLLAAETRLKVARSPKKKTAIDVTARNASLVALLKALELHLGVPVQVDLPRDLLVTFEAKELSPWDALDAVARSSGLAIDDRKDYVVLRLASEPSVTMNVKDMEVRDVLQIVKTQCGIRNLIVDPNVQGSGTFLFNDVPCSVAFRTILRSLNLDSEVWENSMVLVDPRK